MRKDKERGKLILIFFVYSNISSMLTTVMVISVEIVIEIFYILFLI